MITAIHRLTMQSHMSYSSCSCFGLLDRTIQICFRAVNIWFFEYNSFILTTGCSTWHLMAKNSLRIVDTAQVSFVQYCPLRNYTTFCAEMWGVYSLLCDTLHEAEIAFWLAKKRVSHSSQFNAGVISVWYSMEIYASHYTENNCILHIY